MRLLGASAVLAFVVCSGCDRRDEPVRPELPPRKAASAAPSASAPPAGAMALRYLKGWDAGTQQAPELPLEPEVRRAMKLGPQRYHVSRVAIGKGRVGVLTESALVVRDTGTLDEVTSISMHDPHMLAVTADGSLLAADDIQTVWLLFHDQKPRKFPCPILLPISTIFPDRGTPNRFWAVAAGGSTLFGYVLESSIFELIIPHDSVALDGYDGRLIGSMRDGSFIYSTSTGFRRFFGPTYKEDLEGQTHEAFRLLPASRVDTLWLVASREAILFRLVAGKLYQIRSIPLSAMGFDADADGAYLAVLELAEPDDRPWSMTLEVFDVDGVRHVHETFTTTESLLFNDWVRALKRNRRLSIRAADENPLVAVGGPDELHLFRADTGARVEQAPPPPPEAAKRQ
jgi:hypothetical protein